MVTTVNGVSGHRAVLLVAMANNSACAIVPILDRNLGVEHALVIGMKQKVVIPFPAQVNLRNCYFVVVLLKIQH